ncbi:MAG: hypothetical protein JWM80_1464 [Cyanobacteria bacterium RYN_339]|nr:hypothetical protein [Cyanobacteria bacterium RYN_339]
MSNPVRLLERKARRLTMESQLDWEVLGYGVLFLFCAFLSWCWSLANGLVQMPMLDASYMWMLNGVLTYAGFYTLFQPLGGEQVLTLDKNHNTLTVTTRGVLAPKVETYKLRDVIKVHHNRVDDGTFDKHAILFIFRGGGAIQFPPKGGQPKTMAILADTVTRFLGVDRSDVAPKPLEKPLVPKLRVQWVPQELTEKAGTAPL